MIIFDLTRTDWKYKGVLFAEIDNKLFFKDDLCPPPPDSVFHGGIMAIIYVDEQGIWRSTLRIKFISGSKQVAKKEFGKESNYTAILQDWYKTLPMKNKTWTKNLKETPEGILEIIEKLDMIESLRVVGKDT